MKAISSNKKLLLVHKTKPKIYITYTFVISSHTLKKISQRNLVPRPRQSITSYKMNLTQSLQSILQGKIHVIIR